MSTPVPTSKKCNALCGHAEQSHVNEACKIVDTFVSADPDDKRTFGVRAWRPDVTVDDIITITVELVPRIPQ